MLVVDTSFRGLSSLTGAQNSHTDNKPPDVTPGVIGWVVCYQLSLGLPVGFLFSCELVAKFFSAYFVGSHVSAG